MDMRLSFGIFTTYCIVLAKSVPAPTHLLVTRVGACEEEPQNVVSLSELSIATETYDSSVSGLKRQQNVDNCFASKRSIIKTVSERTAKFVVMIEKCLDIRNTDTCDHMKTFLLVQNGCDDEGNEEQDIYGMLFYYIKPKLECPIQAGVYKIVSYPFFTEDNYVTVKESKISTSMFGYIYRLHGYSRNRQKILCVESILRLVYIRNHDWVQNTDLKATTVRRMYSKLDDDQDKTENSNEY